MPRKKITKKSTKKTTTNTTKKVVKKSSAKKKKRKTTAKKRVCALVCAPGEQCFWTTDGQVLENLEQLYLAFGSMDDEVFLHHVTKEKNDFADWVEQVLEDSACAADLRRSKKPSTARTVIGRHLRLYKVE